MTQIEPDKPVSLWSISLTGAGTYKIPSLDGLWGSPKVSPDGNNIAFTRVRAQTGARELWVMGSQGDSPHLIQAAEPQSTFSDVAWAPGGRRLVYRYLSYTADTREISVRSCDLEGKNITTQVRDLRLDSFAWTVPGRFVYSRTTDPGGTVSDKLFELKVNDKGIPQGQSQPLTDWSGFAAYDFSSSSDGRHIVFLRGGERLRMYVAELAQDETRTLNSRSFNDDENVNIPLAWSPDSKEILFSSKRADRRLIYKLNIDQKTPAQLVTNSPGMNFYLARATPDGTAMLFEGLPSRKDALYSLYRAELDGANPRLLFASHSFVNYWCAGAKANLCVLGDMSPASNELVITRFDPTSGEKHETLRIALEPGTSARIGGDYSWQLAPDGLNVAILKRHSGWIKLVPLNGGPTRTITLEAQSDLLDLNWAADSHALFVSKTTPDGAAVHHVDLTGETRPISEDHGATYIAALPSPDGKRLVTWSQKIEANAWIIEDF